MQQVHTARKGRGAAREPAVPSRGREERPGVREGAGVARRRYVNDAFGAAHRAHASVEGITHHIARPAAGLLMEQELQYLGHALESPERPFVAILGGAKVSDKIDVIENLLGQGRPPDHRRRDGLHVLQVARRAGRQVARRGRQARRGARDRRGRGGARRPARAAGRPRRDRRVEAGTANEVLDGRRRARSAIATGVDIGPATIKAYAAAIAGAKTVVWNGPMGVFEIEAFAAGTNAVARAVAGGQRHDDHRRRRFDCGGEEGRRRRQDHAHFDRRRRVARVPRRRRRCRASRR